MWLRPAKVICEEMEEESAAKENEIVREHVTAGDEEHSVNYQEKYAGNKTRGGGQRRFMSSILPKPPSSINVMKMSYPSVIAPMSPGRDHQRILCRSNNAPFISLFPRDCSSSWRRKKGGFDTQEEPSSPKVSCIGRIEKQRKKKKENKAQKKKENKAQKKKDEPEIKSPSAIKIFKRFWSFPKRKDLNIPSSSASPTTPSPSDEKGPSLAKMKKFSSGRKGDEFAEKVMTIVSSSSSSSSPSPSLADSKLWQRRHAKVSELTDVHVDDSQGPKCLDRGPAT